VFLPYSLNIQIIIASFDIHPSGPQSYAHAVLNFKTEIESVQRRMRVAPLGLCLRVFLNEKPLNLEKTTSSVLSVLLSIYHIKLSKILIFFLFCKAIQSP